MNILDEKVRYEHEIRILKEQRENDKVENENKIALLQDQMEEMKKTVEDMKKTASNINNTINNVNNVNNINNGNINNTINNGTINNINITFNNYDKPTLEGLKLTQDDLLVENITKKLIEMIFFNKLIPSNHTIFLPNIKEKRLLMYRDGSWQNVSGDAISTALVPLKNVVYGAGSDLVNKLYSNDESFMKLYPVVREAIKSFNSGGTHSNCDDSEIMEIIKSFRGIIAETLRAAKVML